MKIMANRILVQPYFTASCVALAVCLTCLPLAASFAHTLRHSDGHFRPNYRSVHSKSHIRHAPDDEDQDKELQPWHVQKHPDLWHIESKPDPWRIDHHKQWPPEPEGITRVIFEDEAILEEDYYHEGQETDKGEKGDLWAGGVRVQEKTQPPLLTSPPPTKENRADFPKKFHAWKDKSSPQWRTKTNSNEPTTDAHTSPSFNISSIVSSTTSTTVSTPMTSSTTTTETTTPKDGPPVMMPVTTEGKVVSPKVNPIKIYGIPLELMPIMPGGGSRFDDVEKEKLERKKMSQMKGDDDSAESGGSHEADLLYSSASLASLSLCLCWGVGLHRIDRIMLL